MTTNPVHKHEGQWYFWNEVWADRIGPFDSEEIAEEKLNEYVEYLNKKGEFV